MSEIERLRQAASDIRDEFGGSFMLAVAAALADWLDAVADLYPDPTDRIMSEQSMWDHALALADAYLGAAR